MGKNMEEKVINKTSYNTKRVTELISGDIVLHPIYRQDGLLLINRYTVLTPILIEKIKMHLYGGLPIIIAENKDKFSDFIEDKQFAAEEFIKNIGEVSKQASKFYNIFIETNSYLDHDRISSILNYKDDKNKKDSKQKIIVNLFQSLPLWNNLGFYLESTVLKVRIEEVKKEFINKIINDSFIFDLINKVAEYSELLLIHSINTVCFSLIIGSTLELTEDELMELAIAALFCNVGFITYDKNAFNKYLNHGEELHLYSDHVKKSLELLSNSEYFRVKPIFYGILDHHEKFNGTGAPSGKIGKNISLFGRIIKIAVEYDDLVSGHFNNGGNLPFTIISRIVDNVEEEFDFEILQLFMYRSNIYKIGKVVAISNNNTGTIVGFTDFIKFPHRPKIKFDDGTVLNTYRR